MPRDFIAEEASIAEKLVNSEEYRYVFNKSRDDLINQIENVNTANGDEVIHLVMQLQALIDIKATAVSLIRRHDRVTTRAEDDQQEQNEFDPNKGDA